MYDAVIVDAVRTPIGRGRPDGMLSGWHPVDLLAFTLSALVERVGIEPAAIDDVIVGCVSQVGQQAFNVGRNAVLAAGFPESIPATTIDRQCGSSQQAIHFAAQGITAGAYKAVIAAGVESMSRVPMFSPAADDDPFGTWLESRYAPGLVNQGISAELIAAKWGLGRRDLDLFSAESHRRAATASEKGLLSGEVIPTPARSGLDGTDFLAETDEGVRRNSSAESIAGLPPAFKSEESANRFPEIEWVVTAANSSQISDGASALLLMERKEALRLGVPARAVVRHYSVVGDDPVMMLTGVIPATYKVLENAGLGIEDIDFFEVNEAFASVVLAWQAETGASLERVNVHGGAIANGHPLGATGAKLMTGLVNILERYEGRYGLQTVCEGGGMANATIIERVT